MTKSFTGYPVSRTINVTGIKCAGCEKAITTELMSLDGMFEVMPDHKSGKVTVTYDLRKTRLNLVEEQLDTLGYPLETGFWVSSKRGLTHFKEQNEHDNMSHNAPCCSKPQVRG